MNNCWGNLKKDFWRNALFPKKLLTPEQAAEIIQSRCYQMLCQIRAALDEPNMNDAACFQRIEEIVEIIEQYGSDGGYRHDY